MATHFDDKSYVDDNNRSDEESATTRVGEVEGIPIDEAANGQPVIPPPDQGAQGWLAVFGGFLALFVTYGWVNCMGVFQDYYETHQLKEYPSSTISWISSCESCLMFLMAPVCGYLFDNHGPAGSNFVGAFLHVFGLMMCSISHEYYQILLSQGVCSAMGAGLLFWPTMYSATTWFDRKRGLALGIAASGSGLGGVIMPIVVEQLLPKVGFGWTMRVCAFIILALCIVINLTVKSRLPPQKKPFEAAAFVRPLREPTFSLTAFGIFLFAFGLFIPFNYIILFGKRWGMSEDLAKYLSSILNSASIFGRIIPGAIADKVGRFNVMIVTCVLSCIWVLALWIPANTNALVILFALFYGFTSGAFVSLPPALIGQISEVKQIGVRTGVVFLFTAIGALVGNPIGGALVKDPLHDSYWKLQVFAGVMMAGGSASLLAARLTQTGLKLWART